MNPPEIIAAALGLANIGPLAHRHRSIA